LKIFAEIIISLCWRFFTVNFAYKWVIGSWFKNRFLVCRFVIVFVFWYSSRGITIQIDVLLCYIFNVFLLLRIFFFLFKLGNCISKELVSSYLRLLFRNNWILRPLFFCFFLRAACYVSSHVKLRILIWKKNNNDVYI
jgi:hypothetical protein